MAVHNHTLPPTSSGLEFPDLLRAWRKAKGYTQAQAAEDLGISVRNLMQWEQARQSPSVANITPVLRRLAADGFTL